MPEGGMSGGIAGHRFSAQEPPLQPWALQKYQANRTGINDPGSGGLESMDPSTYCFPTGAPRSMLMPYSFEIVQRLSLTYMLFEIGHGIRRIYTDGRKHPDDLTPAWMGHSIGRWEKDAFVADTVGLREETWLDRAGTPHSEELHMVERFRLIKPDTLEIEFLFEDPRAFTKPWGGKKIYQRQHEEMSDFDLCEDHMRMGQLPGIEPNRQAQ